MEASGVRRFNFYKGHGTENDFIILDDSHGMHDISADFVAAICDRRSGMGADGLVRVVRAGQISGWSGDQELWFMDYRNADGSIAEMCGNGLRVFARHLVNEQLVTEGEFDVATRAGVRHVRIEPTGLISASMGAVTVTDAEVVVSVGSQRWPATQVFVGNPHAVAFVEEAVLPALDLFRAPVWEPAAAFPEGVNCEFVHATAIGRLAMRVFERGVGETRSCGTGVVAAAAAYRHASGFGGPIEVTVPGGTLTVMFDGDAATLTGPAVIVGRGEFWV